MPSRTTWSSSRITERGREVAAPPGPLAPEWQPVTVLTAPAQRTDPERADRPATPAIFRPQVLERLSSPEQLNTLMRVTDGPGWLSLAANGVVLATALTWALLGSVPTRVRGSGILLPAGGLAMLASAADGQLREVRIRPGDRVAAGDLIATLAQPELANQAAAVRRQLRELRRAHQAAEKTRAVGSKLRGGAAARDRARLTANLEAARARRAELRQQLVAERRLERRGILPRLEVQATAQALRAAEAAERAVQAEIRQGMLDRFAADRAEGAEAQGRRERIVELEEQLRLLDERLKQSDRVVSQHAGRVVEVRAAAGDIIRTGQAVASIERNEGRGGLEGLFYVDSRHAKTVEPGMVVELVPAADRARRQTVRATVISVEPFPSTKAGMLNQLQNEELVDTLRTETAGAPVAIRAQVAERGSGALSAGMRFDASVIARSRRPLTLVFPQLARWL